MNLSVVITERAPDRFREMRSHSVTTPWLMSAMSSESGRVSVNQIDAVVLSPPYAEKWGGKPILGGWQIVDVAPAEPALPPRIIVTGALLPTEEHQSELQQQAVALSRVATAINEHNATHPASQIRVVEIPSFVFGLDRLSVHDTISLIDRALVGNVK